MESITINNLMGCEHISIPAAFVDNYISASGDCIKVYLYLLRILNKKDASLVLSDMADKLDMTPNNVKRALKYWENAGIMKCVFSGTTIKSTLKEITFLPIPDVCEESADDEVLDDISITVTSDIVPAKDYEDDEPPVTEDYSDADTSVKESEDDNTPHTIKPEIPECERIACQRILEGVIGQISPANSEEIDTFIIDELGYTYEMIEQLVEYCEYIKQNSDSSKKISYPYIRKIAINWHEMGLSSPSDIKNFINSTRIANACKIVQESLALDSLAKQEKVMIENWVVLLAFDDEIIREACVKARKQRKGIERADYLLNFWNEKNLRDLKAIENFEAKHWEELAEKSGKAGNVRNNAKVSTKFTSFEQRKTDYNNRQLNYKL